MPQHHAVPAAPGWIAQPLQAGHAYEVYLNAAPSLDAVLFLSARNSQVDVVQSVGIEYHYNSISRGVLDSRDAILAHLDERKDFFTESRFHEVVYHHPGDLSFMTFRVSEIVRAGGLSPFLNSDSAKSFRDGCAGFAVWSDFTISLNFAASTTRFSE